jgi:hypothetical protein
MNQLTFVVCIIGFLISVDTDSYVYHNVSVNNYAQCQLARLYEENYYFVEANTTKPVQTFFLDRGLIFGYDIMVTNETNFNMLYALTCTRIDHKGRKPIQSPKVSFVIEAGGLNQLNVLIIPYYGARAAYEIIVGTGETFYFYFPY